MPRPKKTTGAGTKLLFSEDGKEYDLFASISKISPPSMSRGTIDVTDMNSYHENDQFKEFLGGFIEGDEMNVEGYHVNDDAARDKVESAFYKGEECYFKIQLPPVIGKSMIVRGVLTKFQPFGDIDPENGIAFSASIKPNGKPQLVDTVESAAKTQEGASS